MASSGSFRTGVGGVIYPSALDLGKLSTTVFANGRVKVYGTNCLKLYERSSRTQAKSISICSISMAASSERTNRLRARLKKTPGGRTGGSCLRTQSRWLRHEAAHRL